MDRRKPLLDSTFSNRIFIAADSLIFKRMVDSAYAAISEKDPIHEQERYEEYLGFWYHLARDYEKALLYSDSLIALFEDSRINDNVYEQALLKRGDILLALTRYDEAFTWYFRAKQLVLQKPDTCRHALYSGRLASVSFKQKKFKEAVAYYKQSLVELEYCTNNLYQQFQLMQCTYDNIGIMYSRMGWPDSADYYYNRALNYIDKKEKEFPGRENFILMARAVIYGNQAEVAVCRGETEYAKSLLRKSISINNVPSRTPEDAAYSMIKLAGIYLEKGQTDSVARLLSTVDSIRKFFPSAELYNRCLRLKARYAFARGRQADAYRYLEQQLNLYDSVFLKLQSDRETDAGSALQQISRQYQLENANKRKNDYLLIAAIFLAMFFGIIVLLWVNYRRGRKSIAKLNNLNTKISEKNADLLQTLDKLEEMRRDKTKLMHVVAHDLRSPVGSITTLAKMIHDSQIEKEGVPEVLDMIIKASSSAQSLINELLEERARENEARHEPVDVAELLKYSVNLLQYRAAEKEQSLQLQTISAHLLSDREKLLRIFHNLLDNAIKFSPHKAVVRVEMERIDEKVQVRIIDQGIGIPENMCKTLLNGTSSFARQGTKGEVSFGLGLSIVSQLIRETDGHIYYTGNKGKGTVFYLEFAEWGGGRIKN